MAEIQRGGLHPGKILPGFKRGVPFSCQLRGMHAEHGYPAEDQGGYIRTEVEYWP